MLVWGQRNHSHSNKRCAAQAWESQHWLTAEQRKIHIFHSSCLLFSKRGSIEADVAAKRVTLMLSHMWNFFTQPVQGCWQKMESDTSNTRVCFSCDWAKPAVKGEINKRPLCERMSDDSWLQACRYYWSTYPLGTRIAWSGVKKFDEGVKTTTPICKKTEATPALSWFGFFFLPKILF